VLLKSDFAQINLISAFVNWLTKEADMEITIGEFLPA
jgi:hypothetical protein